MLANDAKNLILDFEAASVSPGSEGILENGGFIDFTNPCAGT